MVFVTNALFVTTIICVKDVGHKTLTEKPVMPSIRLTNLFLVNISLLVIAKLVPLPPHVVAIHLHVKNLNPKKLLSKHYLPLKKLEKQSSSQGKRYLARFVKDITMPDGTEVAPSTLFLKIWKIRNDGENAWPINTKLAMVAGDKLSETDPILSDSVAPGQSVDIAVTMTAPSSPGRYVSYYRLTTPDGSRFGHRIWVDILVVEEQQLKEYPESQPTELTDEEMSTAAIHLSNLDCEDVVVDGEVTELPATEDPTPEPIQEEPVPKEPKIESKPEPKEEPKPVDFQKEEPKPEPLKNVPQKIQDPQKDEAQKPPKQEPQKGEPQKPQEPKKEDLKPLDPYSIALNSLVDMGFGDEQLNRALLYKNRGDLAATIHDLLKGDFY